MCYYWDIFLVNYYFLLVGRKFYIIFCKNGVKEEKFKLKLVKVKIWWYIFSLWGKIKVNEIL